METRNHTQTHSPGGPQTTRKRGSRCRTIVEDETELICIFQPDWTINFANKALCKSFSFDSKEDVLGTSFLDLISEKERNSAADTLLSLGSENPSGEIVHWVQRKDGEKRLHCIVNAVFDNGKITEFQAVWRNTTQLTREEELHKEEEDVKALLDAPTDSAILMDIKWKVLAINKIGAMRFGKRKEELIGKDISQYLPAEVLNFRKPIFDKVIRTRKEVHFEDERNGRILSNHIYPLFDSELRVDRFAIFTRDITEKKRALMALEETERVLKEKTRNLEEANIALEVLLRKRERDKEELEEKVWFNVKQIVMPFLEKLKNSGLSQSQKVLANLVESNLSDIVSSFPKRLVNEYSGFTPAEIQVANLIKQGKTKKEIAEVFNCSVRTVEFHSYNIRKKLDIKNKKINLRAHLLSLK